MPISITDLDTPALADYTGLTDMALRTRLEPEHGLFIAESEKVIRRALDAGYAPRSMLLSTKWLEPMATLVADVESAGAPVYVGDESLVNTIAGFRVHRGALASMQRLPLPTVAELVADARRVLVLEDVVDHTNLGAAIRSAAALGVDAVLVTPRCADPLYRRSVRVSMGTVFQVPWTRIDPWPGGLDALRDKGFHVAALALADDAITLDELAAAGHERLALVMGTEGDGLSRTALTAADSVVRIEMAGGVDSLNVAAAAAVAMYATR